MGFDTTYRPQTFDSVVGQHSTIQILRRLLQQGEIFQRSYIFAGPSGTGKTTTARILARAMLCENLLPTGDPCDQCPSCLGMLSGENPYAFQEMDAANHSSKGNIQKIIEEISYTTLEGMDRSVYLIDECFTEDTELMTEGGLRSIRSLVETRYTGKVLSYDPVTCQPVWRQVTDWFDIPDERETMRLTFDNGVELTVTLDQELYTTNRGWVKACELTDEDDVCETQFKMVDLPEIEGVVPCLCGCGQTLEPHDARGRRRRFVGGHGGSLSRSIRGPRYDWEARTAAWNESAPPCACGCGEILRQSAAQMRTSSPPPRYIPGHHNRRASLSSLSSRELAVIYGTLLGDTSILRPHDRATPRLSFTHSIKQSEYARYKGAVLQRLSWRFRETLSQGYAPGTLLLQGISSCHPVLEEVFSVVHRDGTKTPSPQWLDQLTHESLAFWYMDDGSLSLYKGEPYAVKFHTEGFSEEANEMLASFFRGKGLTQTQVLRSRDYFYLYIPRTDAHTLLSWITPYIHPTMQYKVAQNG